MSSIEDKLARIKENGYHLEFTTVFENAYRYWTKILGPTAVAGIIMGGLFIIALGAFFNSYFGGFENLIDLIQNDPEEYVRLAESDEYRLNSNLISSIAIFITYPLMAGLLYCIREVDYSGKTSVGSIFKVFGFPQILNVLIYAFITLLVTNGIDYLIQLQMPKAGWIVGGLVSSIIYALLIFSLPLIIFNNMGAFQAIFKSIGLSLKKFGVLFLIVICTILAIFIPSLITCGFGFVLFFSMFLTITYSVYKEAIGFDEDNEELNQIGDSFKA